MTFRCPQLAWKTRCSSDRVVDRAAGEVEFTAVSETAAVCIAVTNSQNGAGFPSREACPVCLRSMPLRIDGRFRIHGPIRDHCPVDLSPPVCPLHLLPFQTRLSLCP